MDIQYFSTTYLSWVFEKAKQVPNSPNKNGQVALLLFFNCSILSYIHHIYDMYMYI